MEARFKVYDEDNLMYEIIEHNVDTFIVEGLYSRLESLYKIEVRGRDINKVFAAHNGARGNHMHFTVHDLQRDADKDVELGFLTTPDITSVFDKLGTLPASKMRAELIKLGYTRKDVANII